MQVPRIISMSTPTFTQNRPVFKGAPPAGCYCYRGYTYPGYPGYIPTEKGEKNPLVRQGHFDIRG